MNYNKAKGEGHDSHFDINLLQHCLDILNETSMATELRYRTSLVLASLGNEQIISFLTIFLTKISFEEFGRLSLMATTDIEKTEEFLKSNIITNGMNDLLRQFIIPKNHEVLNQY